MTDEPAREPAMVILPRRGRPKLEEPHSTISVWLPSREHDRLVERAEQRGQSVSALVREWLSKLE